MKWWRNYRKGILMKQKLLPDDLKQNLEKINHHGKRADGIVKSMLQHSRSSSGQKELTDINVLATNTCGWLIMACVLKTSPLTPNLKQTLIQPWKK